MMKKARMANISTIETTQKTNFKRGDWIDSELAACEFKDGRLKRRFNKLFAQLWDGIGESVPFACQDWANTKAAYRFFFNDCISEQEILNGHFQSTQSRFSKTTTEPVLILHDTTEFSYQRKDPELIGKIHLKTTGRTLHGKPRHHTICGLLMHSSLVVTTQGLPLGLAAVKFWTRKKFKGCNALKKYINPTRITIEKKESYRWLKNMRQSTELLSTPKRCIHIGDRESDIYELFCTAKEIGTHFVIRTCVDRLAGDGGHTIVDEMDEVKVKGMHRIEVRDKKGELSKAILELKYRRIKVLPPVGKQKHYPELWLTVLHATERKKPKNREQIDWKLITDLSIVTRKDAIEKLCWYAMRWKIEVFHKILKSGCKAENSKLRTAESLVKLLSVFCILSWRIFWMTMISRIEPKVSPGLAFTKLEINLLDHLVTNKNDSNKKELLYYIRKVAQLGGYLARATDPPPGNLVMWRGLSRLTDIELGFNMAKNCG